MKLIDVIQEEKSGFTKTERIIADYITNHLLEFTVSSIGIVAEKLDISKTSLIRFAKKMGFEGFQEFRKRLQDEEIIAYTPTERFHKIVNNDELKSVEALGRREVDNILQCGALLDYEKINALIDKMAKAEKIFVTGSDVASYIAEILCFRLRRFHYPAEFLGGIKRGIASEIIYGKKDDVFIAFEFPDYNQECMTGMRFAGEKGMQVVLVTDDAGCPLVPYADMVFFCDSQTDILKNSLTAPLFFVNILISKISYVEHERVIEFLKLSEEAEDFESRG